MALDSSFAWKGWDRIVKETEPVFKNIESGSFSNNDLSRLSEAIRKQSRLASSIFEKNIALISEKAKSYLPQIQQELKEIGYAASPKNVSKVLDEVFKELFSTKFSDIAKEIKKVIAEDVFKKFQKTAKDLYNDYAKFYGKVPVINVNEKGDVEIEKGSKDADKTDGILTKVYDSIKNIAESLLQLPVRVSDEVTRNLNEKIIETVVDQNRDDFFSEDGVIERQKSAKARRRTSEADDVDSRKESENEDEEEVKKPSKFATFYHYLSDFFHKHFPTEEDINREVEEAVESIWKEREKEEVTNPVVIQGVDIKSEEERKAAREQAREDIAAVWGEPDPDEDDDPKKSWSWDDFKDFVLTVTGVKFARAVKDSIESFSDTIQDKVDSIKKFAQKSGSLLKNLLTGGMILYLVYRVAEKLNLRKMFADVITGILTPGAGDITNPEDKQNQPDAPENPDTGLKQGYGVTKEGSDVYTQQMDEGQYLNVVTDKEGNRRISTSEHDLRTVQDPKSGYKGMLVKEQGMAKDVDPRFAQDDGTYTDYVDPKTGRTVRHFESSTGAEVEDKVLKEKDDSVESLFKEKKVTDLPPDEQRKKRAEKSKAENKANEKKGYEDYAIKNMNKSSEGSGYTYRPATSQSIMNDAPNMKTVSVPNTTSEFLESGKGKPDPSFGYADVLNLGTTRANGKRTDDTLGILNGRDF